MEFTHRWVSFLLNALFKAEERRTTSLIKTLCDEATSVSKKKYEGFVYQGVSYTCSNERKKLGIYPLPFQLTETCTAFISEIRKVDNDRVRIKQLLIKIINNCSTPQEIRDSLPDCLVNLTSLKDYDRIHLNMFYLIESDKYNLAEYKKLLPVIEAYSVSHLIY